MTDQVAEQGELAGRQQLAPTIDRDLVTFCVELDVAGDQLLGDQLGSSPSQGSQSGKELAEGEGLGQVVIGSGVETLDAVLERRQCGEHQHGRGVALAAHRHEHLVATDPRQQPIEDHDVVVVLVQQRNGLLAVGRHVHRVVLGYQDAPNCVGHPSFVFDQQ